MIWNILAPTDGSEHGDKAVRLAAQLASRHGARLHFLHVLLEGGVPEHLLELSDKKPGERETAPKWMVSDYDGWMASGYHRMITMATSDSLPTDVLENIADKLLARARQEAQAQGVEEIEVAHVSGPPAPQILRYAREVDADTIVMGARGLTAMPEVSVGGVCHKVQRVFPGIVVTVR